MPNIFIHIRCLTPVVTLTIVCSLSSRVSGQSPSHEVYYSKLDPKDQFKYKWKGKESVCNVGVFRWEVPRSEFGTNGLDRNFTGYCAEILVPISEGKLYRFRVNSLYDPSNYDDVVGKENAATAAQKRAVYVQELFGRYFRDPVLKSVNADEALGLQVALWEVVQESEPAEGQSLKLDLFGGDFQANYAKGDAPGYVLKAQEYLDSLTGDDGLFYRNADLRGRELIRLQGIANAEGVVAQSQFALRYAGGAGAGVGNLSQALLGGAGAPGIGGAGIPPLGGLGAPGGFAPFFGTGGGVGSSSPSSGSSTPPLGGEGTTMPPTTTTTTPLTPPIITPPVNGPPPTTPITPITPVTPSSPVPAPAGLILGAIALGTLGAWRFGARYLARK